MKRFLRHSRYVAGLLSLAAIATGIRYAASWTSHDVAVPLRAQATYVDRFSESPHSLSPMRVVSESSGSANWEIAVVTNRTEDMSEALQHSILAVAQPGTLSEQVADAVYYVPETKFGFAPVNIPLGRPCGQLSLNAKTDFCVSVGSVRQLPAEQWDQRLDRLIEQSDAKDILIFVHGFNVSLEESIARAAQIAEDTRFHGLIVNFSWPSLGDSNAYLIDEQIAEHQFWNLAELLSRLHNRGDQERRIHVVAHSMGNRVTLRALGALAGVVGPTGHPIDMASKTAAVLDKIAQLKFLDSVDDDVAGSIEEIRIRFPAWGSWERHELERPAITNLILAAPDVGTKEFTRILRDTRHLSQYVVLCTSDTDVALVASGTVHADKFRAGDSRSSLDVKGIEYLTVSGVTEFDPLGHSYYGSNPVVLDALFQLTRPPFVETVLK